MMTHKLEVDFTQWTRPCIDVPQDDQYSRNLRLLLKSNGLPYEPPGDCSVLIRYTKPDRIQGAYDTMPDGTKAWELSGNLLTLKLAPQLCTAAGRVHLVIGLFRGDAELNSFSVDLFVRENPRGAFSSEEYLNVTRFLPQPEDAQVGGYLKIEEVDAQGRVTATSVGEGDSGGGDGKSAYDYAVEGGYTGSEEDFAAKLAQENIVTCNLDGATEDGSAAPMNADTLGGQPAQWYENDGYAYSSQVTNGITTRVFQIGRVVFLVWDGTPTTSIPKGAWYTVASNLPARMGDVTQLSCVTTIKKYLYSVSNDFESLIFFPRETSIPTSGDSMRGQMFYFAAEPLLKSALES